MIRKFCFIQAPNTCHPQLIRIAYLFFLSSHGTFARTSSIKNRTP